jgi:hypothetical protein
VAADGKLYVTNMQGQTLVLAASPQFKLLSINELEEMTRATPAIAGSQIFIRTYKHIYCIGSPDSKKE